MMITFWVNTIKLLEHVGILQKMRLETLRFQQIENIKMEEIN